MFLINIVHLFSKNIVFVHILSRSTGSSLFPHDFTGIIVLSFKNFANFVAENNLFFNSHFWLPCIFLWMFFSYQLPIFLSGVLMFFFFIYVRLFIYRLNTSIILLCVFRKYVCVSVLFIISDYRILILI